jgi:transcriptional regulator with XRE-family HTH domain
MSRLPVASEIRHQTDLLVDVLVDRRDELGLTAEELAQSSGIGLDWIRKLERYDSKNPGFFTVAALADALDVGLDELRKAIARRERGRKRARTLGGISRRRRSDG